MHFYHYIKYFLFLLTLLFLSGVKAQPYTYLQAPGDVQSYEFDLGGEGMAYHDLTESNTGLGIRPDESVDFGVRGSGDIELISSPEEWVEYSVNVQEAGFYSIALYYSLKSDQGQLSLTANDTQRIFSLESTGGHGTFFRRLMPENIPLQQGVNTIRLSFLSGNTRLRSFELQLADEPGPGDIQAAYAENSIPGIVQAQNFDLGGEGVAYHDLTEANTGFGSRLDESVDFGIRGSGDLELIASTGEWLEYTLDVNNSGLYSFDFNYSLKKGTANIGITINNSESYTLNLDSTGGHGTFRLASLSQAIGLNSGSNILRLEFESPGVRVRRFEMLAAEDSVDSVDSAIAWIEQNFQAVPVVTGSFNSRQNLQMPILVKDADASNAKYAFSLRDDDLNNDRRAAFVNVSITDLIVTNSRYGAGITTSRSFPETVLYLANVYIEPNWPLFEDYDTTNQDGIVLDGADQVYGSNVTIHNWNSDAAIDNKANISQFVGLVTSGSGYRAMRYWRDGPHYLVDSQIDTNNGTSVWFRECDTTELYVYNTTFNGSPTLEPDNYRCDRGSSPTIIYLESDPREAGVMHPMFTPNN